MCFIPPVIEDNLSTAWAKVFLNLMRPGVSEIQSLMVIINGFNNGAPIENNNVRFQLDSFLSNSLSQSCNTVANTIFPSSLYNPNENNNTLYTRYKKILPQLRKCPENKNGLYFERMIKYGVNSKNQLDFIIDNYNKGCHRRSALQVSIFNPDIDHSSQPRRGFPCLQHVVFSPMLNGKLSVTGFYATQYAIRRAYGNYLGLCRLGNFVSKSIGLELGRMVCITGILIRDYKKSDLSELTHSIQVQIS